MPHLFTDAEYRQHEADSPYKYEHLDGAVRHMGSSSSTHSDICMNIGFALKTQLRGKPYKSRLSDQRIRIDDCNLTTHADVVVTALPERHSEEDDSLVIDATAIVEVLSNSTANYDRGVKFVFYRHLPSLRHYILVAQDEVNVEHRLLNEQNEWQTENFTSLEDSIRLEAIGCILKVSEIYEDIENLDAREA